MSYDAVGNVVRVIDNFGVQVDSIYDPRDLLASRTWQGGGVDPAGVEFDYNARGERTETRRFTDIAGTQPAGRSTFDHDAIGRLTGISHHDAVDAVFANYDYVYDLANQLTSETHHGQSSNYTHDATGQLTVADHQTQTDEGYTYDANGNRVSSGYVVGPNNQILSDATFDYLYDAEGNLVRQTNRSTGAFTEFEFDHRNRMVSATEKSAGGIILRESTYTYDVFDRRIAKTVDLDGAGPQASTTTRFVYDGDHVWADLDGSGQVTARYLFGDRTDELLARWHPGDGLAWYLADHLGTVRDIANAAGLTIINHLDYDSFGNIVLQANAAAGDRFTFTGREYDAETALYYYRARYYSPTLGRFISQDPRSFGAGDANLYRYVFNSPLNYTDPTGEETAGYSVTLERGPVGAILLHPFTGCLVVTFVTSEVTGFVLRSPTIAVFGPPKFEEAVVGAAANIIISAVSCALFPPAGVAKVLFGSSVVAIDLLAVGVIAARGAAVGSATFLGENLIAMARREYEPGKPGRKKQGREPREKKKQDGWQPRNPPREPPPHTPSKKP